MSQKIIFVNQIATTFKGLPPEEADWDDASTRCRTLEEAILEQENAMQEAMHDPMLAIIARFATIHTRVVKRTFTDEVVEEANILRTMADGKVKPKADK